MRLRAREHEHFLLGIEPPFTACANHDNIGNVWRHHDSLSTFSQFVLIMLHIATDSCLLSLFSCRMYGCNYAIGYIIKYHQCNFCYHMHKYFMLVPTMAFLSQKFHPGSKGGTSGVFYEEFGDKVRAAIKDPSSADKNLRYYVKKNNFQLLNLPSLGARDVWLYQQRNRYIIFANS